MHHGIVSTVLIDVGDVLDELSRQAWTCPEIWHCARSWRVVISYDILQQTCLLWVGWGHLPKCPAAVDVNAQSSRTSKHG